MTKIGLWLRLSVPATLAYCHRVQRRLTPPAFGQGCADNSQNTPNFPSHETLFGQPLTRQISSVGSDLKISKSVVAACGACGQPPACGRAVGNARRFPRAVHRIARSAKAGIGAADCPQIHRSLYLPGSLAPAIAVTVHSMHLIPQGPSQSPCFGPHLIERVE